VREPARAAKKSCTKPGALTVEGANTHPPERQQPRKNGLIYLRVRQLPIRSAKAPGTRFLHNRGSPAHSVQQFYGGNV